MTKEDGEIKAFIIKHKKILLCLLIVLLLGITVYTVCCFNGWGVQMSDMPAPYLWIYLRTNGFPDMSYASISGVRSSIAQLEEGINDYGVVNIPAISYTEAAKGWAKLAEVVASYYGLEYTNPFND